MLYGGLYLSITSYGIVVGITVGYTARRSGGRLSTIEPDYH